jgi:hypothetical protein
VATQEPLLPESREQVEHNSLHCTVCGDRVPEPDLREHLAGHHPAAWGFSVAEVRNCFTLVE